MTMLKRREETRSGSVSLSGSTATFNGFQQNLPAGGNDGDECGPSDTTRPHHITRTRTLQSCFWTRLFQTVCVFTPEAEPSLHLFILHRQTVSCKSGGSNPVIQMQVKNKEQNQRHLPRREIKTKNRAEEDGCFTPLSDGDAALHRTCLDVSYLWRRSIIAPTRTFFKEQYSCQRVRCCTDTFR